MWLINCRTLTLEEVVNPQGVKYAILSHTWQNGEEIQFGEFRNNEGATKRGWRKIRKTCEIALHDGYEYAWCDTCCIDKTSSAELAEAINSMFLWYANSDICYVYLADYDASDRGMQLGSSVWLTRGWTLQELIAPSRIRFYDKSWKAFGTKTTLSYQLSLITGIEEEILHAPKHQNIRELFNKVPIARRMAWASKRQTTRIEDMAYCLLGIFGVNLPLLYGEGEHAFIRLQEEIIKNTNDLSLFAWRSSLDEASENVDSYSGVLAQHPRDFQNSDELNLTNSTIFAPEFTVTNKGIKIETSLEYYEPEDLYVLDINCHKGALSGLALGIFLKHQGASVFARARHNSFASGSSRTADATKQRPFFLSKILQSTIAKSLRYVHRYSFVVSRINAPYEQYWTVGEGQPEMLWDSGRGMFITAGLRDFVGCYEFVCNLSGFEREVTISLKRFFIFFGYGYGFEPWSRIVLPEHEAIMRAIMQGQWRTVADLVYDNGYTLRKVGHMKGLSKYLNVKLEHGVDRGEPIYLVKCYIGDLEKES